LEENKTVPTTTISINYPDADGMSVHSSHTALELTTDYLMALKNHLVSVLGRQIGPTQAQETPLEFILTVPAVWSEYAKEKTLVAAEKAGLGRDAPIHMISEPVSQVALSYFIHMKLIVCRKLPLDMFSTAKSYTI
jgi:molecular chaperone DnaK (HSP70)